MEIKLKELKQIEPSLGKLLNAELPIKASYRLSKIGKVVKRELEDLEEARLALFKKYGEVQEDQSLMVPQAKMQEFIAEMDALLDDVVNLDTYPVKISLLGNSIQLTAMDLVNLDPFLEIDDESIFDDSPVAEPKLAEVVPMPGMPEITQG